jgi:hypothetical protein
MTPSASQRAYLVALGTNLLFFLWAWLVNQRQGLFFFTTDELGVLLLLALAVVINALLWLAVLGNRYLMKAFGLLLLLLLSGCTAAWVHGYVTGVSS